MQGKIKPHRLFLSGIQRNHFSKKNTYQWGIESLLWHAQYNPAEGIVTEVVGYFDKYLRKSKTKAVTAAAKKSK